MDQEQKKRNGECFLDGSVAEKAKWRVLMMFSEIESQIWQDAASPDYRDAVGHQRCQPGHSLNIVMPLHHDPSVPATVIGESVMIIAVKLSFI